jgi:hypothetical protein
MCAIKGRRLGLDERGSLGITGAVGLRSGGALARIAVVYGGPSPEHDVSILTGLQAVSGFSQVPNIGELHSFYWSKTGAWFEVPTNLEASAFVQGQPRPARRAIRGKGAARRDRRCACLLPRRSR